MKTIFVKLSPVEYNRYTEWITNHFMKVARPFIFHDIDGNFYCLNHGLPEGGLLAITTDEARKYAEEHSNIKPEQKLNIVCCFGAGVEETDNTSVFIKSEYPILVGADEKDSAMFGVLESDSEIPELVKIAKSAGYDVIEDKCKLEKGNA